MVGLVILGICFVEVRFVLVIHDGKPRSSSSASFSSRLGFVCVCGGGGGRGAGGVVIDDEKQPHHPEHFSR